MKSAVEIFFNEVITEKFFSMKSAVVMGSNLFCNEFISGIFIKFFAMKSAVVGEGLEFHCCVQSLFDHQF
jgi:hypothetical protein